MKRLFFILPFFWLFLFGYELDQGTYRDYTLLDPALRAKGLIYPQSWLQPHPFLFLHNYEDSSFTYGRWDQLFYLDPLRGTSGFSAGVTAKYIPYSFPQRWSAAMEWLKYKGSAITDRSDAVLHYRHQRGETEYYLTRNLQTLQLQDGNQLYDIRSQGLDFRHHFSDRLGLSGGINFHRIAQKKDSTVQHDVFQHSIEMQYLLNKPFSLFGTLESRHFWVADKEYITRVFRPGLRYSSGSFFSFLGMRIAINRVLPLAQISFQPGPIYFEAYLKVRDAQFILEQAAQQYAGLKTSLLLEGKKQRLLAEAECFYDWIPGLADNYYGGSLHAEYRFQGKTLSLYGRGNGYLHINTPKGYYYPEMASFALGMEVRAKPAGGKMHLDADFKFLSILHENPDNVKFDAAGLYYYHSGGDSEIKIDLKASVQLRIRIQSFAFVWDLSSPIKSDGNLNYYLYEGIYASSDFLYGSAFFTSISFEWYWWK